MRNCFAESTPSNPLALPDFLVSRRWIDERAFGMVVQLVSKYQRRASHMSLGYQKVPKGTELNLVPFGTPIWYLLVPFGTPSQRRILLSEYWEVLALAALVPVIFFVKFLQQTEKNEEIDVFFVFLKKSGETCRRKLPVQLKMTFYNPIKRHFIESQRNTYQLKRLVSCRPIKSIISNSKKVDGETWRKLVEENGR